jgi:hypothetical protein
VRAVSRSRAIVPAAIAASLLANFWLLEDWLAERSDLSGSWISDLAARTQVHGWRFQLLEVASGLAVAAYAALLLRVTAAAERPPLLRRGLLALLAAGLLVAIGGAAPLNCAEALERACDLSYDPFDLIHTTANLLEIAAVAIAFGSVGLALLRAPATRRLGQATLAIGAAWLLLTACSGLSYPLDSVDSFKGLCQRSAQILFGAWLVLLTRLDS